MNIPGLIMKFLFAVVALWAVLVLLMTLLQGSMLFPRSLVGAAPALPSSAERLNVRTEGGHLLHGVRLPGRGADGRPLILGFGGNAWHADALAQFLHQLMPEHTVVAFQYRGYAPSTGRPSAAALRADALAIHDDLAEEGRGVIAVGLSIGAGVAAHLAAERAIAGAVLVTPFDSLTRVGQDTFPWAPVRWLFRHEMNALGDLARAEVPVAMVLAARDEVIPPARAEALVEGLRDAGRPPAHVARLEAGHNDIYGHPDFAARFRAAFAAVAP